MASRSFAGGGLRVTYSDELPEPTALDDVHAGVRDASGALDDPTRLVVDALAGNQFTLVEGVELTPPPAAGGPRMAADGPGAWRVDLDLGAAEDAVVLLDHDGVLSWRYHTGRGESGDAGPRERDAAPRPTVTFELTVGDSDGVIGVRDAGGVPLPVLGRVRAFVFRFLAGVVADHAMEYFERDLRRGLVVVGSSDPTQWKPVSTLADVPLPVDRSARILLLVHGTFSSTLGSFAAVAATPEGRAFLDAAITSYDAVIGFDHPTVSLDPEQNAHDLLGLLESAQLAATPSIDIVAYSRGGLVARSLMERVVPASGWKANAGRAVFIGATNGGTSLVEPANWREFVDIYTNLAMAATRAVGLISGNVPIAEVVRGAIDGVAAFVKYLVVYSIDEGGVPGLAAMKPDGAFVHAINADQPLPPGSEAARFVISSDFQPRLIEGEDRLRELPPRLIKTLVDGLADQLFGTANDLVVDTTSMSAADPAASKVTDTLAFGSNGRVYHLAYFIQPEVALALKDWLVDPPAVILPRTAQRDIAVLDMTDPVDAIRRRLDAGKSWVVVRNTGGMFANAGEGAANFPLNREMITTHIRGVAGDRPLNDVIDFDNLRVAPTVDIAEAMAPPLPAADPQPDTVIVAHGQPIAVVPQPPEPMALRDIIDRPEPPPAPADDEARLTAQLDDRVKLGATATVTCTLSRTGTVVDVGGVEGRFPVDVTRDVVVQLIPMRNAELVGAARVALPMPAAGEVVPLLFDFTPTQAGSCEVWVVARQGERPLMTLMLKAVVEQELSGAAVPQPAAASVGLGTPVAPSAAATLMIFETVNDNDVQYRYTMYDEARGIDFDGVSPDLGDRETYIKGIFTEIESARVQNEDEAAEFLENLQDIGAKLFRQLFPDGLQRKLWAHRDDLSPFVIRSSEPVIPWELVHLRDPDVEPRPREPRFLGQLGLVRSLPNTGVLPATLRRRAGRVRSLCAKYENPRTPTLAQIDQEALFLKDELGAVPVEPTMDAVRQLLFDGQFDIFHFAGHGLARQDGMKQAVIQLADVKQDDNRFKDIFFSAENVEGSAQLNQDGTGGPLIVLNACQVGRASVALGQMGGFAQAFLNGKAGAFVSTLWSVDDKLARTFVEEFYKQLLAGETVATAVRAARDVGRQSSDISWLAYVVYANPAAKLEALPE